MMNIIESIVTNNPCYKSGRKITVKGLMLHSVGCSQPSTQVFINTFNKSTYTSACVHAFIDGNTGAVYQTLPWNHRGWHGGSGPKGCCNDTHIGVEMCEPSQIKYTSGSSFTCTDTATAKACVKCTYDSAVELFAYLCKQYGLNPLTDICSHKEGCAKGIATNHGDPEHLWNGLGTGYTMDGFRRDVQNKMNSTEEIDMEELNALKAEMAAMKLKYDSIINKMGAEIEELRQSVIPTEIVELEPVQMIYNYIDENMPEWARESVQWCVDNGIVKGTGTGLGLTDDKLWMCVVLHRMAKTCN